ncbi:hypothetical protein ACYJ1Y_06575 [Natrialbaceae archaeon A-gly3]
MTVDDYTSQFNLYDIFASFLPGAFFLLSVIIPYRGIDTIFLELPIGGAIVFVIFSYTIGLMMQALGGSVFSGEDEFASRMRVVTEGNEDEVDSPVKPMEVQFIEEVRAEFGLDANYDDWESVYKLVLAKLEASPRTRAIRLQALFLAMRGFAVAGIFLLLTYVLILSLDHQGFIESVVSAPTLLGLAFLSIVLSLIGWSRGSEFSEDVIAYMILEYTLERNERKNK